MVYNSRNIWIEIYLITDIKSITTENTLRCVIHGYTEVKSTMTMVPSGNKPLPELILREITDAPRCHVGISCQTFFVKKNQCQNALQWLRMHVMVSQITINLTVCSTGSSVRQRIKCQNYTLLTTGGFPSQRVRKVESVPCHEESTTMMCVLSPCHKQSGTSHKKIYFTTVCNTFSQITIPLILR